MATANFTTSPIPAAAYIRMSSGKQEKSPAQQKVELQKLADREGYTIVATYADEAVTGDSGPDQRPGFRQLLQDAAHDKFQAVLCWAQNRIGRFDSLDAGRWLSTLRDSDVKIVTVTDGTLDLTDAFHRLKLSYGAEASHDENLKRASAVLRGMVDAARRGFRTGGKAPYGFDRAEYTSDGILVRRLAQDEMKSRKSNYVGLIPSDQDRLAAVLYAYTRFASASIAIRALARELEAKGFPSPSAGWNHGTVHGILTHPIYVGMNRWNAATIGRYYSVQDGTPTRKSRKSAGWERNPEGQVILSDAPHKGVVPRELWETVQRKLARLAKRSRRTRESHPLSGLMFCGHCGEPMHRHREISFLCKTYGDHGRDNASGCGYHTIEASAVLGWLTRTLQEIFLGPGRESLVAEIKRQLASQTTTGDSDTRRLEKRLRELDQEIFRLRTAIRKIDDDGLVDELASAKDEHSRIAAELSRAGKFATPADVEAEAERIADLTWTMAERLGDTDPAVVAAVLGCLVSRIECTWTQDPRGIGSRVSCRLATGHVILKDHELVGRLFSNGTDGLPLHQDGRLGISCHETTGTGAHPAPRRSAQGRSRGAGKARKTSCGRVSIVRSRVAAHPLLG